MIDTLLIKGFLQPVLLKEGYIFEVAKLNSFVSCLLTEQLFWMLLAVLWWPRETLYAGL